MVGRVANRYAVTRQVVRTLLSACRRYPRS